MKNQKVKSNKIALNIAQGFKTMGYQFTRLERKVDEKIDTLERKVDEKIDTLERKVDEKIDTLGKKVNKLELKVEKIDETLNIHTLKFVDIEAKMDNFVTKNEFNEFRNESNNNFDQMMVILNRLDQERVFTNHRFNRIEKTVGLVEL